MDLVEKKLQLLYKNGIMNIRYLYFVQKIFDLLQIKQSYYSILSFHYLKVAITYLFKNILQKYYLIVLKIFHFLNFVIAGV